MNSTTELSNRTDGVDGSETWEELLQNCSSSSTTNKTSQVNENVTSTSFVCAEVGERKDPESFLYGSRVRYLGVLLVLNAISVGSVVANSLPLAAIIKYEALHKPVFILMANMAASDIVAGVCFLCVGVTAYIYAKAGIPPPNALYRFLPTSFLLSALSSSYSLLALTAERYWFIVHGLTYEDKITNDRCKVAIIVVWLLSSILALLPVFGWSCTFPSQVGCSQYGGGTPQSYLVLILILVFIPMAAIVFFNLGVFRCLWRQVSDIRRQEAAVQAEPSTSRKSAVTILIITIVFLVSWLPYSAVVANEVFCKEDCNDMDQSMIGLVILNSAVNPIIYGFRLKEIRRNVKRLFVGNAVNGGVMNAWSP
ncbi:G-protein coupled receptor 6-like [Branchiostoma floridae]|nr:G-protein coupled receptor 6-like [Branchiostoma floridae]